MLINTNRKPKLNVGDLAPEFTLPDQKGRPLRLSDFREKKVVVLYFYPKDNTKYCIVESTTFRDQYEVFKTAGAEVVGISSDPQESHVQFSKEYHLPFLLLSDTENKVRKLYGVRDTLGLIPGRVTFVIDKSGVVRHVFSSQFDATSHVTQALAVVKSLPSS